MKLGLLNTTICTADGVFYVRTVTLDEAKRLIAEAQDGLDSAIGHESTAQIMSDLLGVVIPVNRKQFIQEEGQKALVFKLNGRPPEGKILSIEEIEEIGYQFKVMESLYGADLGIYLN